MYQENISAHKADPAVKIQGSPAVVKESSTPLPEGRLADTELPEALLTAGKHYPTAEGYALVSAAEIGCSTDKELKGDPDVEAFLCR